MENVKISVIVPVFNVEKYIDNCIESVLKQTYPHFELILVNDGSTDSSYDHIIKYKEEERVTIINKPNTGQSDSRYRGLMESTGDYIYYVDSDDTIEENALQILADDVRKYNSDVVFGRYRLIDENGKELRSQSLYDVNVLQGKERIVRDSLCVNNFKASLCLKLIKRSLLLDSYNNAIVRSLRINEDVFLSFLLSTKCNTVTFKNDIIYNVLQRGNSLSRSIKPELITVSDVIYNEIKGVLNYLSLFSDLKADYYGGYTKNVLFALAVTATHSQSYKAFISFYSLLDSNSIFFSKELKDNIHTIPIKYRILYVIGKSPLLFYYILRFSKHVLQY